MGRLNKRALLSCLRHRGTASRTDLAKLLGLSQPTAGKIVDELLEREVLEEVCPPDNGRSARLGRPARMLRLTQSKTRFLGLHLGVSQTRLARLPVGDGGEDRWTIGFDTPPSAKEWSRRLGHAAHEIPEKSFWGILVSVPGLVDEKRGKVLYSPNLHWTEETDLAALLAQTWNAPVLLLQEERALALGHHSTNPSGDDFLLVDFGEGVGGAVTVEGKLYNHALPIGGELGHAPVLGNQRRCGCGAVGCLETLASTRGLLESFSTATGGGPQEWPQLTAAVANEGLPHWLKMTLDATAAAIAAALNVLGVGRVVITGTIAEFSPSVISYLSSMIANGSLWARFGKIQVEAAPRRRAAGLLAAGIDHLIVPVNDL